MKLFFNILLSVLVGAFLLVALLLLISSFRLPGFPLDARSVLTGSMEPTIPTGSIVFIYPRAEYGEGDVVTFKRMESSLEIPVTHRIIAVAEGDRGDRAFKTKGDANESEDMDSVSQNEIYGKVIFHLPYIGYLLDAAKTPWGFAALIIVPALLVIMDEIKKIAGYLRRKEDVIEETEEK